MHEITNSGWIEVITGCMFSGKTEELLKRVRRAENADKDVLCVIPETDTRYGSEVIASHNDRKREAVCVSPDTPMQIIDMTHETSADVVAIDEGNFFDERLVEACTQLADQDVRVIVSGTDQTFRGTPFVPLPTLMAEAEYVDKMTASAVCAQCGDPASRNQRLIDGEPAPADAPTLKVGGEDSYEPRCRYCHIVPDSSN